MPTVLNGPELMAAQRLVRRIPVGESIVEAILKLVRSGRPEETDVQGIRELVAWGPGPRASQALMLAVRARALLQGRLTPSMDDVLALAGPILRHRMALTFAARAVGELRVLPREQHRQPQPGGPSPDDGHLRRRAAANNFGENVLPCLFEPPLRLLPEYARRTRPSVAATVGACPCTLFAQRTDGRLLKF